MNETELTTLFQAWWRQSYPHSPPYPHSLATHVGWGQYLLQHVQRQQQIDRATLAQPEPVGPTDAELETTARAAEIQYTQEHGGLTAATFAGIHAQLQAQRLAGLRAVLARWGRPAITPIPVSERLPGPEDCDADGSSVARSRGAGGGAMSTDYISLCADHSDRIAALEAQREAEKAAILEIYEKLDQLKTQHKANWAQIVKLEAAGNHPAKPDSLPASAGGLVKRVTEAINKTTICERDGIARAAILAVAEWLYKEAELHLGGGVYWSRQLREEVQRHG